MRKKAEPKRDLEKDWQPNQITMELCSEYKLTPRMIDIELVLFRAWHLNNEVKRNTRGFNQAFQGWIKRRTENQDEKEVKTKDAEKRGGKSYKSYAPKQSVNVDKSVGREALDKMMGRNKND